MVVPPPAVSVTATWPPIGAEQPAGDGQPEADPRPVRAVADGAGTGRNTCSRSGGAMPGPWSITRRSTLAVVGRRRDPHRLPRRRPGQGVVHHVGDGPFQRGSDRSRTLGSSSSTSMWRCASCARSPRLVTAASTSSSTPTSTRRIGSAPGEAAHVEQVGDQGGEAVGLLSIVVLNSRAASGGHSTSSGEEAGHRGLDRGKGRPQVVRHGGEQSGPELGARPGRSRPRPTAGPPSPPYQRDDATDEQEDEQGEDVVQCSICSVWNGGVKNQLTSRKPEHCRKRAPDRARRPTLPPRPRGGTAAALTRCRCRRAPGAAQA